MRSILKVRSNLIVLKFGLACLLLLLRSHWLSPIFIRQRAFLKLNTAYSLYADRHKSIPCREKRDRAFSYNFFSTYRHTPRRTYGTKIMIMTIHFTPWLNYSRVNYADGVYVRNLEKKHEHEKHDIWLHLWIVKYTVKKIVIMLMKMFTFYCGNFNFIVENFLKKLFYVTQCK